MFLAIDFDHTIVNGREPLPGAKDALQHLHDAGHHITIHSCNSYDWIQRVLNDNDIPYDRIWDGPGKPIADCYVDDRAIQFRGNWAEMLKNIETMLEIRKGLRELGII